MLRAPKELTLLANPAQGHAAHLVAAVALITALVLQADPVLQARLVLVHRALATAAVRHLAIACACVVPHQTPHLSVAPITSLLSLQRT
jgi:hypothetical protein